MKQYNSYKYINSAKPTILTLGTFDGVHKGHQSILNKVTQDATANGYESVVLTFFPHPRMVLQKDHNIKLINTIEEKAQLLQELGIQHLILQEFTKEFANLSAEQFVEEVLVKHLNIKKIIIGYDHRFGKNRSADIHDLMDFGRKYKFDVEQISAQEINEVSISSTKIRKALEEGKIETANDYLGTPYFITGNVIKGKQLGRTIGFPTANIQLNEDYKLIPKIGAYIVSATIDGKLVKGMMNIGYNPTVNNQALSLEVHFLDFDKDIYDKKIQIHFHKYLRDEQKFPSLDALKQQLAKDLQATKDFIL